jgi:tritrans,polycis-undecaprenyl-diphosphate synthase [geranylgeranyl-diphosphate specific]
MKNDCLNHLAIVLDGNRRFAKKLMMQPWKGHEYGAQKIETLFEWIKEFGIKELTLYCFSLENFNRPKEEFSYLINIFKSEFSKLLEDARVHENKIRIHFSGKLELFDQELQDIMMRVTEKTKDYSNYIINFALGYGGRQEIIEAANKLAKAGKEINEENLMKHLWIKSEPDLIIRTGGEKRTSNFLMWQSAYSEWIFLDKMWPEFTKEDLITCINEFKKRERRFGK